MQLINVVKLYIGDIAKYPIGKLSVIFPVVFLSGVFLHAPQWKDT